MNNLHRELAPISAEAWSEIEEETSRTLKRYLAARRVVDVDIEGVKRSAVGTGHTRPIEAPATSLTVIRALRRGRRARTEAEATSMSATYCMIQSLSSFSMSTRSFHVPICSRCSTFR